MGAFVAATQKDHYRISISTKVDTIPRTKRDSEFKNPGSYAISIAEVSQLKPIDPGPYDSSRFDILQMKQPIEKGALATLLLVDDYRLIHVHNVALKLLGVNIIVKRLSLQ